MKSKLIILLFCIPLLSSCDDIFEPALEPIYDENMLHTQPTHDGKDIIMQYKI